jgi:hypothetical protein
MNNALRAMLLGTILGLGLLTACASEIHKAQTPLPELSIGVACFSQPTNDLELMAGYIPDNQGKIDAGGLLRLDDGFRAALDKTGRACTYLNPIPLLQEQRAVRSEQPGRSSALAYWVNIGKKAGVDLLIVPMVVDWHEREGSDAGVTISAAVTTDMFLIDARGQGNLLQRSFYREKQVSLSNNILDIATFLKRGGKWVTAEELAGEAMQKAIQEFGL